ncbi:MAG: hypothetical protein ACOYL1_06505, partial [Chlamydiia bacterium]
VRFRWRGGNFGSKKSKNSFFFSTEAFDRLCVATLWTFLFSSVGENGNGAVGLWQCAIGGNGENIVLFYGLI